MELDDRRVLVTGATAGIGRETARLFARRGARVVVTGRDAERGAETVATTEAEGGQAEFIAADFGDIESVQRLADRVRAPFFLTKALLPKMIAKGSGSIVNVSTMAASMGTPAAAGYNATKAALESLTRSWAADFGKHGIRVNAVAPSLAAHPFLARVTSEELLAGLARREAFGRAAEPWEVANVMVFLASDYASYLTGEVVSVSSQHP